MFARVVFAFVLSVLSFPVSAQTDLGFTGAVLDLGSTEDEQGVRRNAAAASVDVRVTGVHGLQGDLSFAETAGGTIGRLGAHLYMAPRPGQKYGLFLSLSDVDGRSMSWVGLGAECMVRFGERTFLESRAGLGAADDHTLDYIFGSIALAHAVTDTIEIEAALDVADFDEAAFRATAYEASLTARYRPERSRLSVYASVSRSGLTGRDGGPSATRVGLGLTIDLGRTDRHQTATRPWRRTDPVAPLVRRGLR